VNVCIFGCCSLENSTQRPSCSFTITPRDIRKGKTPEKSILKVIIRGVFIYLLFLLTLIGPKDRADRSPSSPRDDRAGEIPAMANKKELFRGACIYVKNIVPHLDVLRRNA